MCYLEPSIVFKAKVARHVRIGFMFYLTMFVDLAFESMFLTPSIVRKAGGPLQTGYHVPIL